MAESRMVRKDILSSDSVNSLTWGGEVFYRRLMSVVDDFGRYDGRCEILRSQLYPLKLDNVSKSDIGKWLNECSKAGLIRLYSTDGRDYVEILKFNQRLRVKKSKYPAPKEECRNPPQSAAECGNPRSEVEVEVEEKGREDAREQTANQFRKPIPPTKMQVWEYFSGQGATKEMAKSFYEKHEGVGWYMNGSPIVNWAALANRFITNWKCNETGEPTAPPLKKA